MLETNYQNYRRLKFGRKRSSNYSKAEVCESNYLTWLARHVDSDVWVIISVGGERAIESNHLRLSLFRVFNINRERFGKIDESRRISREKIDFSGLDSDGHVAPTLFRVIGHYLLDWVSGRTWENPKPECFCKMKLIWIYFWSDKIYDSAGRQTWDNLVNNHTPYFEMTRKYFFNNIIIKKVKYFNWLFLPVKKFMKNISNFKKF